MNPKKVYYFNRAIMGLAFNMIFTATALYRIDIAQLEIYQLILIGTAMELSIFLFEIPTGVVADLKSRRTSVIIGIFVIGLATVVEVLTPYFLMIFFAQVLWGFGYTFISGALQSWMSDEMQNKDLSKTVITGTQINIALSIVGIMGAAILGNGEIKYALYGAAALMVLLGIFNICLMKEEHFTKHDHDRHIFASYIKQFNQGFKHIKEHHILKVMFIVMLFFGLYSEGIDRTYEIHILNHLDFRSLFDVSAIWILSIINTLIVVLGFILMQVTKKYMIDQHVIIKWLMTFTILMMIGILLFGLLPQPYLAVGGFLIFHAAREASSPLLDTVLLTHTPSKIKATTLSTFGQIDAIGQILSGLLMVVIGLTLDIKFIYIATAALLIVPVFAFAKIRKQKDIHI